MSKVPSYYQDDSQGKYKGIDFDNLQILIISGIISAVLFLFSWLRSGMTLAMVYTLLFIAPVLAWVFLLRHNKPKSNDIDFFESILKGGCWEVKVEQLRKKTHPFITDEEWLESFSEGETS